MFIIWAEEREKKTWFLGEPWDIGSKPTDQGRGRWAAKKRLKDFPFYLQILTIFNSYSWNPQAAWEGRREGRWKWQESSESDA